MARRRRRHRNLSEDTEGDDLKGPVEIAGFKISNDLLVSLGGLVLGFILLAIGLVQCSSSQALSEKGRITQGKVVAVQRTTRRRNKRSVTVYIPTIRFKDHKNRTHTFKGEDSSSTFREGKSVEVIFDPDDPENARENTGTALWATPTVLIIIGLVCFVFAGITGWRWYVKRGRAERG